MTGEAQISPRDPARPMRVLQVTESFATGTMEVVKLISEGVAQAGHRVTIAYGTRPETPADVRLRVAEDVDLVELPWTGRTVRAQAAGMLELRRLARRWRPDVIHLHSSFAGAIGSVAAAGIAPTVYTPHAYSFLRDASPFHRSAFRMVERFVGRRVDLVGAVSESEAGHARSLGVDAVRVVPNGIPELDREPARRNPPGVERPLVVTMGRIVPQRRPAETARILAAVSDIAEVCWIGGPGPDSALADAVREHRVPVTGWVDREEAVEVLSRATVLLNWSAWDSHPLSVLESMALDVVAVGSRIDANLDLLGAEQVRATEHDAIELLRGILQSPDTLTAMLERQRTRSARLGTGRMVRDWLDVYGSLATSPAQALTGYAGSPAERPPVTPMEVKTCP